MGTAIRTNLVADLVSTFVSFVTLRKQKMVWIQCTREHVVAMANIGLPIKTLFWKLNTSCRLSEIKDLFKLLILSVHDFL